jgi:HK97 family phage prohead protease
MDTKQFEAADLAVKSVNDDKGEFTALVSVFGNVDLVGDRVMPGAFTKSIEVWQGKSESVPVIFSHKHDDPMAYIGEVDPSYLMQTDRGLFVKGSLDLTNPYAAQTYKLMQRKAITGFSFGYTVPLEQKGADGARELHEIDLFEVGPTFKGANPAAGVLTVKSAADALLEGKTDPASDAEEQARQRRIESLYLETLLDL